SISPRQICRMREARRRVEPELAQWSTFGSNPVAPDLVLTRRRSTLAPAGFCGGSLYSPALNHQHELLVPLSGSILSHQQHAIRGSVPCNNRIGIALALSSSLPIRHFNRSRSANRQSRFLIAMANLAQFLASAIMSAAHWGMAP